MDYTIIKDEETLIKFDSGFFFGKGLFETILIKDKPIFLKEHLLRLNNGLKCLGINFQIEESELLEQINGMKNCALKLMVSEKNVIISSRAITYTSKNYKDGFKVKASKYKRNPYSPTVALKSFNYMDNILEKNIANNEGYDEVLFFNTHNILSEGSMSNVFIVKKNHVLTPSYDCGLLKGVVRDFIIKNLKERYNVKETKISLEQIKNCDGMFLTNSLMGIMWVSKYEQLIFENNHIIEKIKIEYENYIK